ncbi:ABC transporter permease [Salibacterium qingdaonense]|uniref:Osmoprotectant transport system permease protein n=1 Tax=Salibacterium qingdaonense TaxID=266892 RepID=A0A1I4KPJ3_9BACI|nr:ABC transporter permease [Salibacterium qingdaonense]SFL80377.1 osmoprotectant transport system permease protein [Salibacterium qingdaonense]
MNFITELAVYMAENSNELLALTIEHILMVACGIALSLVIGIPLGILAARFQKLAPVIISITNVIQLVPSLAMLAILMLYLGFGFKTIAIGLFLYSLLPIVKNTYVGIKEVDDGIKEAGIGIGMSPLQLLAKIQFPLSIPYLMAGLRLAAVIAVSVAAIGPYIGAGGLGKEIISGISLQDDIKIYAGAIPATLIAIIADLALGLVERKTKKRLA